MATYKAPKPTKQQLSQAAARSKGQIPMDTTAKQLRGTTKIIAAAASMIPVGRAARAIATARTVAGIAGKGGKMVEKIYKPTGPTREQQWDMRHDMRIQQEKISEKQLKEHYSSLSNQWNH